MLEIIFLSVLALIWLSFAMVQDLREREIANWLNFSLIAFAFGFRFFFSLFSENFGFFYQGIIGLGIFFVLGNVLYYSRFFAGGDAKLMMALGAVLPFSESFFSNAKIFMIFLLIFLFAGASYSLSTSLVISLRNFKKFRKGFKKQFKIYYRLHISVLFLAVILAAISFLFNADIFILAPLIILAAIPYLFIYAKAVDESCMIKKVRARELREGDWLYKDVKIGKKIIKADWGGLKKEEIKMLRKKHKHVLIRHGVPFSPVFLISFIILIYFFLNSGLWKSLGFV